MDKLCNSRFLSGKNEINKILNYVKITQSTASNSWFPKSILTLAMALDRRKQSKTPLILVEHFSLWNPSSHHWSKAKRVIPDLTIWDFQIGPMILRFLIRSFAFLSQAMKPRLMLAALESRIPNSLMYNPYSLHDRMLFNVTEDLYCKSPQRSWERARHEIGYPSRQEKIR